jgi:hypothetical protein
MTALIPGMAVGIGLVSGHVSRSSLKRTIHFSDLNDVRAETRKAQR